MSSKPEKQREHPSTYIVQDRSNEEELLRLKEQDRLVTADMGGLLPEQKDLSGVRRVLDVGCGTGGWLIELAQALPAATTLIGVDVSGKMLDYAREQARLAGVAQRVEFAMMDTLRMLEFPQGYFDLVNQRFGISYLRTWDWPYLLEEYQRVTRPGGIVRITESDLWIGNTPAFEKMSALSTQAFANAGHLFFPARDGLTRALHSTMSQADLRNLQAREYTLEYRGDTPKGQFFAADVQRVFRTSRPFISKWTKLPDDFEQTYQQALAEMQQPDFVGTWRLLTVWGTRP